MGENRSHYYASLRLTDAAGRWVDEKLREWCDERQILDVLALGTRQWIAPDSKVLCRLWPRKRASVELELRPAIAAGHAHEAANVRAQLASLKGAPVAAQCPSAYCDLVMEGWSTFVGIMDQLLAIRRP